MLNNYGWKSAEAPCSSSYLTPKIIQILKNLKISTVLDVGCGNGTLCGLLHQEGFSVIGAEYDKTGFEIARQAYPHITFYNIGVYDSAKLVKCPNFGFDCVVSTEVIEHLFSPQFLPIFASQVLKTSGYLVISTPYHGFLKNLLLSLFNHWDIHHGSLHEGGHIKFLSKKTINLLLQQNGYKMIDFFGVGRIPYLWKSMIIVAQKSQNVDG